MKGRFVAGVGNLVSDRATVQTATQPRESLTEQKALADGQVEH